MQHECSFYQGLEAGLAPSAKGTLLAVSAEVQAMNNINYRPLFIVHYQATVVQKHAMTRRMVGMSTRTMRERGCSARK